MKKYILILCMSLLVLAAYSQGEDSMDNQTTKELSRKQKKEQQKAEEDATVKLVEWMVNNHQFYFEITFMNQSTYAFDQSGGWVDVSGKRNYMAIDSNKIVLQLEPSVYLTTNWGIDYLPKTGTLLPLSFKKLEKSGNGYLLRFRTAGQIGDLELTFNVSTSGKTLVLMGKNNGEKLQFRGVIIPFEQSRMHAGVL